MASYVTVDGDQVLFKGELFYIGQKRKLSSVKGVRFTRGTTYGQPQIGDEFTIRNIIYPLDNPEAVFLCCEFDRRTGGHNCSADRRGLPPWPKEKLCKDDHGEYMQLHKAASNTQALGVPTPHWEV